MFQKILLLLGLAVSSVLPGQAHGWRSATEAELTQALPARAPVEKERIETEMRTASGIADERGHLIAGVVLITAGYSADGKYSHYLLVGSPLRLAALLLPQASTFLGGSVSPMGLMYTYTTRRTVRKKETYWPGCCHLEHMSKPSAFPRLGITLSCRLAGSAYRIRSRTSPMRLRLSILSSHGICGVHKVRSWLQPRRSSRI